MTVPKKPNINDILGTSIVEGGGKGGGFGVDFSSFKNWWNKKATEKALNKLKIQRKKQREEVDKELSSKVKVAQEGLQGFNKSLKEKNQADLAEYYRLKTDGRISVDPEVKNIITPKTPEQYKLDLKKAKRKSDRAIEKETGQTPEDRKIVKDNDEAQNKYGIDPGTYKDIDRYSMYRESYLSQHVAGSERQRLISKDYLRKSEDTPETIIKKLNKLGYKVSKKQLRSLDEIKLMMDADATSAPTFLDWVHGLPKGKKL